MSFELSETVRRWRRLLSRAVVAASVLGPLGVADAYTLDVTTIRPTENLGTQFAVRVTASDVMPEASEATAWTSPLPMAYWDSTGSSMVRVWVAR